MYTREEAKAIVDKVLNMAKADAVEVNLTGGERSGTRWANSTITTNLVQYDRQLTATGVALVYRSELNSLLHARALAVTPTDAPVSAQRAYELVARAHPESRIVRIEYPRRQTEALLFWLETADGMSKRNHRYTSLKAPPGELIVGLPRPDPFSAV